VKLRATSNSIRLRLSQSDVRRFAEDGSVEDALVFGSGHDETLRYRLERVEGIGQVVAKLAAGCITVSIPAAQADRWTSSDEVGISSDMGSGLHSGPDILVEKDFACLTPRSGDDDVDTFPHPAAANASRP
jgi:hypothetical protein